MRLGDEDPSGNFIDRTGQSGVGGGGNMLGCLVPLVFSRFGLGGLVILLVGYFILTSLGGTGGIIGGGNQPGVNAPSGQSTLDPNMRDVMTRVLGSTERQWSEIFARNGMKYEPTTLVAYSGGIQTACGFGEAVAGPFYCSTDKRIYVDPTFFNELAQRFGAPGDFAIAYVIAHEVGHHVQDLMGTLDQAATAQARASQTEGNHIQVGLELQADCLAGVWAANDKNLLEPGDAEEGMRAAEAIGDDTLQRQSQGVVVPDSFTHGTSAQRAAALRTGLQTGDPAACKL